MVNDESNALSCSKRAFSDVLEGVVLEIFLGVGPRLPFSLRLDTHYRPFCII